MCRVLKGNEVKDIQEKSGIKLSSESFDLQYEQTNQVLNLLNNKATFPTFYNFR